MSELLPLHQFAMRRVSLKKSSMSPSLVTKMFSSTRLFSRDMYRVLSCYHPSEAPRHSRPIYQRLGRIVHLRITIPYGYQFQEIEKKEVGGPPRPSDAGVPVTTSQSDCGSCLTESTDSITARVHRGYRHRRHRRRCSPQFHRYRDRTDQCHRCHRWTRTSR